MSKVAGKDNFFMAKINDGTGLTVTVAAAATPDVIVSQTLFTEDTNSTNGGLTFDATTGKVTCAKPHGFGKYRVSAVAGDLIGTNSSVLDIELNHTPVGGSAAQFGIGARKTELASATRHGTFQAVGVCTLDAVGETVDVRLRVGTNGHAGTFRDFALVMEKIAEID